MGAVADRRPDVALPGGIARAVQDPLSYRERAPETVDQVMGNHQADCVRAVRKWKDTDMPAGPRFQINRQLAALIRPIAEFSAWTGALSDIDVRRPPI